MPSNKTIFRTPSVIKLFDRIRRSRIWDGQMTHLLYAMCGSLLFLLLILLLGFSQYHNCSYNARDGPFHINYQEFIDLWKDYSGNVSVERPFFSSFFSSDQKYLQIELGRNQINDNPNETYSVYFRHPALGKLLYTFHAIRDVQITDHPMKLLIKFPTGLQRHFHQRLPYRFNQLNSDTLECVAQQIGIELENNETLASVIAMIEEIYDRNITYFNAKVPIKCGILLGYFDDPVTDTIFAWGSNQPFQFKSRIVAFDASSSYSCTLSSLFAGLLILLCISIVIVVIVDLVYFYWNAWKTPNLANSPDMKLVLNKLQINSLEIFDYLIMKTAAENNYHNRLFLLDGRYLIVFLVDMNETKAKILRQFEQKLPFMIIDLPSISEINTRYVSVLDGYSMRIILLPDVGNNDSDQWLHQRLINCNDNYRYRYFRALEERRQHRLNVLISEEEQIQNTYERMFSSTVCASSRFIAEFRLRGARIIDNQLSESVCCICQESFQSGDHCSQWPCEAQHTFHYNCMLNVLRTQNRCPLCRHAVEEARQSPMDVVTVHLTVPIDPVPRWDHSWTM